MDIEDKLYYYKAFVNDVYDADTITVNIDLGMGIFLHKKKIRLFGINAPEMRGPEKAKGTISRDWLRQQILHKEIILQTVKDKAGKFGRLLGIIYKKDLTVSFNDLMVTKKLAVYKEY